MESKPRRFSLAIAIAGATLALVLSSVSALQHIRISREGFADRSFCTISETVNCDIVNASSYSEFLGYPIAWWGIAYYSALLVFALKCFFSRGDNRSTASFSWFIAGAGLLYCIFLAYVASFILGVVCLECLGMYLGTLLVWLGFFPSLEVSVFKIFSFVRKYVLSVFGKAALEYKLALGRHILLLLVLFTAAAISYPLIADVKGSDSKLIGDYMNAHFQQGGYELKPMSHWPVWGNPDAKVTIVEFSEFQCPFCRISALNFRPYLYEFRKKVRYYFVNYPLDSECNPSVSTRMHPHACVAARAGICASRFGEFWNYHDEVFRNQKKINEEFLIRLAEQFGWDPADFKACMDDPSTLEVLKKDIEEADRIRITGTPTIFVNDKKLRNWRDKDFVRAVIREEVKRSYR